MCKVLSSFLLPIFTVIFIVCTGPKNGAALEIEHLLEKEMLWLPCRHHVCELVLETTFHTVMGPSKGPRIKIFEDFQKNWSKIDQSSFSTVLDCPAELSFLDKQTREGIIAYAQGYINVSVSNNLTYYLTLGLQYCRTYL